MFCAKIPALEDDLPSDRHSTPSTILIAASDARACLYAVERVRCGTFALCKLGVWVTLKELKRLKLECSSQSQLTSTQRACSSGNEWWRASAIRADWNPERGQFQKQKQVGLGKVRLCLKSPLPKTFAASPIVKEVPIKGTPHKAVAERNDTSNEPPLEPLTQDPDETLRMIRTQYQEALYMSQVRTHWLSFIRLE